MHPSPAFSEEQKKMDDTRGPVMRVTHYSWNRYSVGPIHSRSSKLYKKPERKKNCVITKINSRALMISIFLLQGKIRIPDAISQLKLIGRINPPHRIKHLEWYWITEYGYLGGNTDWYKCHESCMLGKVYGHWNQTLDPNPSSITFGVTLGRLLKLHKPHFPHQ